MSAGAEGVDLAVVNRRRRARPVAVLHLAIANIVGMRPENLAGGGVQADDAFLFARRLVIVHRVDTAAGDGDAGVATADRLAPARAQFLRELRRQFRLLPHAVAVGTAPLRPVLG